MSYMHGYGVQHYLPVEQAIDEAITAGATHCYVDGSYGHSAVDSWSSSRLKAVKQRLADTGVTPAFHGDFHQPLVLETKTVRRAAQEYVQREIDLAAALGAPLHFIHAGAAVATLHPKQALHSALDAFAEAYHTLRTYGQAKGVRVLVENLAGYKKLHPFYYVCTSREDFRYMVQQVPEVEFLLDIGHAHVHGGDPVGMFREFAPRIVALSLSDNTGQADAHSPLGSGSIDLAGVTQAIKDTGWQGYVFFETRGAGLQEGLDYLQQLERLPRLAL